LAIVNSTKMAADRPAVLFLRFLPAFDGREVAAVNRIRAGSIEKKQSCFLVAFTVFTGPCQFFSALAAPFPAGRVLGLRGLGGDAGCRRPGDDDGVEIAPREARPGGPEGLLGCPARVYGLRKRPEFGDFELKNAVWPRNLRNFDKIGKKAVTFCDLAHQLYRTD